MLILAMAKNLKRLFWDIDVSKVQADNPLVFERVLNYGDVEDVQWLFAKCSKDKIITFVSKLGETKLNKKSYNFWKKQLIK